MCVDCDDTLYDVSTSTADDTDCDGVVTAEDCDDSQASVYEGAPEVCDGLDNDCDDLVDEDLS